MGVGEQTVEWLYREQLQVDAEWSVTTERGFRWWPFMNAQTIEVVGQEVSPDGDVADLVGIRTEVLRNLKINREALVILSRSTRGMASMAGPIVDRQAGTVEFGSLVRVHQGIAQWMNPFLAMAAALQMEEAHRMGQGLLELLDAEWATSGHPDHGPRETPDEIMNVVAEVVRPMGQQPSRWTESELTAAVEQYMQSPPSLLASGGGLGLTVEFPFGPMSSLCQIKADEAHPMHGNGLLMVQHFPILRETNNDPIDVVFDLNNSELTQSPHGYGFGGFVLDGDLIEFRGFFPNVLYRAGLIPNLYFACAERARMMDRVMTGSEWNEQSFTRAPGFFGHLLDSIGSGSRE